MINQSTLPLVSVVIPTYNSAKFIPGSITSVLNQTYPNVEILIIDDGSSDETEKVVSELTGPIRYIKQVNSGPSAARNNGLTQSTGKYIAFLDVDDEWEPSKLEEQITFFESDDTLSIVATGYIRCDADLQPVETIALKKFPAGKGVIPYRLLLEKNQLLTSSIVIKKETLDKCGLFNENIQFGEDWDQWLRIAQHGAIGYVQAPLCKYRVHGGGLTGKFNDKNMSDWRQVIEQNRLRTDNWYDKNITYRKSLSWYMYNYSYVERVSGERAEARRKAIKAILIWPFSLRTLRIIKRLLLY